jgi:hypothetical protein
LIPVEAKSGKRAAGDWVKPIEQWRALAGDEAGPWWIVYGGDDNRTFKGVEIVSWRDINRFFRAFEPG